jgi:tripartite-type tricarboxylate transporter receptor subunit TctC
MSEMTSSITTKPMSRRTLLTSGAALAASVAVPSLSAQAQVQNWPTKPVRVLVGFAAGGNIDNLARVTCQRLSEVFGQQFVVENRVGAMGTLAAADVVRSPADGYTLFWAAAGTVSIFPAMGGKAPYSVKDLVPVSLIGTNPQVLIINGKLPIKTLQEFVAWVKANPGKFAYAGGGGPGSVSNLLMALFLARAGLKMNAVSYRGTAPALTDIIGGHVPAMFIPLPEALPHVESGAVRMLAVSDDQRAPHAPEIPTIAESGYPGFRGLSWNGMMAHAGTPRPIIDRVASEFVRASKDPKFIAQLDKYGAVPVTMTPEQFGKFLNEDMALWAEAVKIAGVTLDSK